MDVIAVNLMMSVVEFKSGEHGYQWSLYMSAVFHSRVSFYRLQHQINQLQGINISHASTFCTLITYLFLLLKSTNPFLLHELNETLR